MKDVLTEYLMADVALIQLKTFEYTKSIAAAKKVALGLGFANVYLWKQGLGAETLAGTAIPGPLMSTKELLTGIRTCTEKSLVIIQDIHRVYEDKMTLSELQEIIELISAGVSPINIVGVTVISSIPDELERYAYLVSVPLPTREEIKALITERMSMFGIRLGNSILNRLAEGLNGLIEDEIIVFINRIVSSTQLAGTNIDVGVLDMLKRQKKLVIEKSGMMEFVEPDVGIDDVGGLHNLKRWLKERREIFDDMQKALQFGLKPPKGILLFGMPGSGKSLTAKIAADYYNLPLLRVDMGLVYGQKSPEEAMGRMTALADAISPCILWIDELEKALAGSESGASNDVSIKILGILLTWMQERTAPVFIIATANDISMIRPETYRDGRIDEKFFLGFLEDDIEQIEQILTIHLKKRLKGNYDDAVRPLDMKAIATKMNQMVMTMGGREGAGYTGANMEALVEKVLQDRFVRDKPYVETMDFVRMLNRVKPQHGKTIKQMLKRAEEMEAITA